MIVPQSSPQRTRRYWRRGLLAVGLVLVLLVAGVLVFRQEIAGRVAAAYLEGQGIAVQSLEVTRLTPEAVEVSGLALGAGREVTAARVTAMPLRDGLAFSLQDVAVEGLRLKLDVTGEAPLLGSLQPAFERLTAADGNGAAGGSPMPMPALRLVDARVALITPSGPMTADLAGHMTPGEAGGLQATARLNLDSALGRLRADLDGQRRPDGTLELHAAIAEGQLDWQDLEVGAVSGDLDFVRPPDELPRLTAKLDLKNLRYGTENSEPLHISTGTLFLDGTPESAALDVRLEGGRELLDLSAEARATPAGERRDVALNLEGELRTAGGLAAFLALPGPQVTAGTLVLEASGKGSLPDSADSLAARLEQAVLQVTGEAIFGEVALADGTRGISGHLPLAAEVAQDTLTLSLSRDAALRVEQPSRAVLQDLGVPDDILPLIASGLSLTLRSGGDLPFRLASSPVWPPREAQVAVAARGTSDQGLGLTTAIEGGARLGEGLALAAFSGRIDSRLTAERAALGGREARGIEVALPLSTRYGPEGLSLALTRPGELRIGQLGAGAPLRLEDPLAFTVSTLDLRAGADGSAYDYRLEAQEDGATLSITRAGAAPLALTAGALELRLDGRFAKEGGHDATLDLWLSGFDLPGYDIAAEAAQVTVGLDGNLRPARSRFRLGPVSLGGAEPLVAPLALVGEMSRRGGGYDITGTLGLAGRPRSAEPLADLSARYGDDGRARLEAVSRSLTFSPEGLQPGDLSPLLAALEQATGSLTAKARLAWPLDPAQESGRVSLTNLGFQSPAGRVRGLNLDLDLVRLLPPASRAGQRLTIDAVDAAVPVDGIEVVFALDQAPRPQLAIARGAFGLGGARWQVEPLVIDPAEPRHRVVAGTEELDLATFFRLIEVDGLSGNGTLAGKVPIVFEGEDVIVEEGRFEAQGPGVLSIRIEALRSALSGSGETVEKAARALENFHYESLTVTLSKTADNDATVRLSTLGKNPDVLEGQPFRFNINLESNLTSVLAALKQGYSLSDEALRRAWRLRE